MPADKKPGDTFTFMVPDAPVAQAVQPVPAVVQGQAVAPVPPATVIVQNTPVYFGRHSVQITCPTHGTPSQTVTSAEVGLGTWLICLGLCCVGCDLGCCFIPFCVDDCKDIKHTCSNCGTFVGEKRLIN